MDTVHEVQNRQNWKNTFLNYLITKILNYKFVIRFITLAIMAALITILNRTVLQQ